MMTKILTRITLLTISVLIAISVILIAQPNQAFATTQLYENCTNAQGSAYWITVINQNWDPSRDLIPLRVAQIFTAQSNHSITSVELYMAKTGSTDNINVSINTVDSNTGLPTDTVLTSGSVSSSSLNDYYLNWPPTGTWLTVNLTPYNLVSGTQYAIVVASPSTFYDAESETNILFWFQSSTSTTMPSYPTDIGLNTWYPYPDYKAQLFKVWGEDYSVGPVQNIQTIESTVQSYVLPEGITSSLLSKLNSAIESYNLGFEKQAKNQLNAFIKEVTAKRGKTLSVEQADALITLARSIFP